MGRSSAVVQSPAVLRHQLKTEGAAIINNAVQVVNDIATLRTITPNLKRHFKIRYRSSPGDDGQGSFRPVTGAAPSTYMDNGGTIIVPNGGDGSAAFVRDFIGPGFFEWFGAKGDGSTDDNTAVTSAVTALSWIRLLPGKYYRYSTDIELPASKPMRIEGPNSENCGLLYGGSGIGIKTESGTVRGRNHVLKGFKLQGYGITIQDNDAVNYHASNTATHGLVLQIVEDVEVNDLVIFGFVALGAWGLKGDAENNLSAIGCWRNSLRKVRVEACRNGVQWRGASGNGQPNENLFEHVKVTFLSDGLGGGYAGGVCWSIEEGDNNVLIAPEADGRDFTDRVSKSKGFDIKNADASSSTRYLTVLNPRMEFCSVGITTDANVHTINWINPAYFGCDAEENFSREQVINKIATNGSQSIRKIHTSASGMEFFSDADNTTSGDNFSFYRDGADSVAAQKVITIDQNGLLDVMGSPETPRSGASPSVDFAPNLYITQTGPTTISALTGTNGNGIVKGCRVVLQFGDANTTLQHGANIKLRGGTDILPNAGDVVEFICVGFSGGKPVLTQPL